MGFRPGFRSEWVGMRGQRKVRIRLHGAVGHERKEIEQGSCRRAENGEAANPGAKTSIGWISLVRKNDQMAQVSRHGRQTDLRATREFAAC